MKSRLISFLLLGAFFYPGRSLSQLKETLNKTRKPNIIFILTDDLGYGDLGVFFQNLRRQRSDKSEPWLYTPALDSMAAKGAMFLHQYVAAPVCAPSRASLILGVSQGHCNVRDNQFDKAIENNHTIGTVMQQAGYTTAVIGKWGLQGDRRWDGPAASDWPAHPLNRGFDYYYGYMRHEDGHEHYPKEGLYRDPKQVWENRKEVSRDLDKCYTGDLWTAATKKWITEHISNNNEKPFFLFLAFDTPHATLEFPAAPYPAGGGLNGGVQWTGKPGRMINTASGDPDSWCDPLYANAMYDNDPATKEVPWPDTYKRYATVVTRIDHQVADLLQLLKDVKIDSSTMVVFTSDNGPSAESYLPAGYTPNQPDFFNSFGPFNGIKRDCLEGGIRVPSIVSWPGRISPGTTIKTPCVFYDWMPTFSEMAGLPAPARTDGVSLLPALTGTGIQKEGLVYIEYNMGGVTPGYKEFDPANRNRKRKQMQMIRTGDTVGLRYNITSHKNDFEIYDIIKDPEQKDNLALRNDLGVLQERLKARVLQVRRPDTSAPRPYDGEAVPPVSPGKNIKQGVVWKFFEGNFPWIPAETTLNYQLQGDMAYPGSKNVTGKKTGMLLFEGYIHIPENEEYVFTVKADNKTFLRIHDAIVIDNDYGYKPDKNTEGKIKLQAGYHPFRLYCAIDAGNNNSLPRLEWRKGNSSVSSVMPADAFLVPAEY